MIDNSKIFITGAGGQLGLALQAKYPTAQKADASELDITDEKTVTGHDWSNTQVLINAAAYTDVDGAETPGGRKAAQAVNAVGAANLAKVSAANDIILVHISTDYVFDGTKAPHKEDEPFSPLSVYGASKADGDKAVSAVPKHYLLRTSWVIGEGKNFVRIMLELGKKGVSPTVVADQIGRPTFTTELVRAIDHLLSSRSAFGTYNISNDGEPVSWADLSRAVFKEAGYDLTVTDTSTTQYFAGKENIAARPANSVFDLSKIKATGFEPTDWRINLSEYIKKELAK